eukprot:scaffold89155_cov33-Tisochrysis_lutea.AAC.4
MAIVVSAPPSDPADLDVLVAGLAVGNEAAAHSRSILSQHRVLALLNATPTPNPWSSLLSKRSVALLQISVEDKRTEELYPHFEECCNFIGRHRTRALREAARRLPGESAPCVLVHCQQGISRSVTLVLAYLMRRCAAGLGEKRPSAVLGILGHWMLLRGSILRVASWRHKAHAAVCACQDGKRRLKQCGVTHT